MSTGQVPGASTVTGLTAGATFAGCKPGAYQDARSVHKRWRGHWAWLLMLALGTGSSIAGAETKTLDRIRSQDIPAVTIKTLGAERKWPSEHPCAAGRGTERACMPIAVETLSPQQFGDWIGGKQIEVAKAAAGPAPDEVWSLQELKSRGQKVFLANCAICHQAGGEGIPGTFPALRGSKITTGPIAAHLDIVIHGSKKNPIMPAWGKQLSDLDLASVITYERNAWSNNTGDVIEPADVRAAR